MLFTPKKLFCLVFPPPVVLADAAAKIAMQLRYTKRESKEFVEVVDDALLESFISPGIPFYVSTARNLITGTPAKSYYSTTMPEDADLIIINGHLLCHNKNKGASADIIAKHVPAFDMNKRIFLPKNIEVIRLNKGI